MQVATEQRPDLVLVKLEPHGTQAKYVTIANEGQVDVAGFSIRVVGYHYYGNLAYRADIPITNTLGAGQQKEFKLFAHGGSQMVVTIDPENRVRESNEKNNRHTVGMVH